MRRVWPLVLMVVVGCSGPIALDRAIWTRHREELAQMPSASAGEPRDAWYAWRAEEEGRSVAEIRAADLALPVRQNPFDARRDGAAVSRGALIYQTHCLRCHGADVRGGGQDMLAAHPTKDFHAFGKRFAATLHGGAPRSWFHKISEGYGDEVTYPDGRSRAMPAFGDKLAREQIWLVITYLQSLDIHAQPDPDHADA